jgi:colanic acid/amylovoran biosynthesis protein
VTTIVDTRETELDLMSSDESIIARPSRRIGLHLGLFGASMDTMNLGVSALAHGTIRALDRCAEVDQLTVFDYGLGESALAIQGAPTRINLRRCGVFSTRRVHRPESLERVRWECRLGVQRSIGTKVVQSLDAILDLSGGDSFSDIYGRRRFDTVAAPKFLALQLNVPLVLLPQTYGPFFHRAVRLRALRLCHGALVASARDEASFERLAELLGDELDEQRHFSGVDMAFAMPPETPSASILERLNSIREEAGGAPMVGLNVSGLVYGLPDGGVSKFGFQSNYTALVETLCSTLVKQHGATVILIPHVLGTGGLDADPPANEVLLRRLPKNIRPNVHVLSPDPNPAQAKGLISKMDWFCGTRMHATIAALSTGTPVATILYSDKAAGVFKTCGMLEHAIDPRVHSHDQVVEKVVGSFLDRENLRVTLAETQQRMAARVRSQTQRIVDLICNQRGVHAG